MLGANYSEDFIKIDPTQRIFWTVKHGHVFLPLSIEWNWNYEKIGDINWPPRSPDLTMPDYYLWRALKGRVYQNNPQTIGQLTDNI